jgi:hypothetical protein
MLSDKAAKVMPVMSLLMTEILRFLRTGQGHSVEALGLILMIMNFAENVVWCGLPSDVTGELWVLLTILIAIACRVTSTLGSERPSSAEPRFRPNPPELAQSPEAPFRDRMRGHIRALLQFFYSFRGKTVMFLGNAIFSVAFYSYSAQSLKKTLKRWPTWKKECDTAALVDSIIWFSFASVIVSTLSLLGDVELSNRDPWRRLHAWIPVDRYFRCTTLLKATMLYFKVDVYLFSDPKKLPEQSTLITSVQVLSIVSTILLATWPTMTATILAVIPENQNSTVRWRLGKTFRWSCFLSACVFQALSVTVLLSHALALPDFQKILNSLDVGIGVNVADPFVFAYLPFMNEMTISLTTSVEPATYFYRVQSVVCLQTLAAICAVKLPLHALNDWIYDKQTLQWGYVEDLLTGTGTGGPVGWIGGWVPPVITYMTFGLVGFGALVTWSSGSPDGHIFH